MKTLSYYKNMKIQRGKGSKVDNGKLRMLETLDLECVDLEKVFVFARRQF